MRTPLEKILTCYQCGGSFTCLMQPTQEKFYLHTDQEFSNTCPNKRTPICFVPEVLTLLEENVSTTNEWWSLQSLWHESSQFVPLVRKECLNALAKWEPISEMVKEGVEKHTLMLVKYSVPEWALEGKVLGNVPPAIVQQFPKDLESLAQFGLTTFLHYKSYFLLLADRSILTENNKWRASYNNDLDVTEIKPGYNQFRLILPSLLHEVIK